MGELIEMPVRNNDGAVGAPQITETPQRVVGISSASTVADGGTGGVDLTVWKRAPKERTTAYFPTYSTVSKAMQTALRGWVREWFHENTEILLRPYTAYPVLVYQCTHPFAGRPTNMFTYDIQQTETLNRAFASAVFFIVRELR